jgi:hypothetical protein
VGELDRFYAAQSSNAWYHQERDSLQAEAAERGMTVYQVEAERAADASAYRLAESRRVAELVSDPILLRQLQRYWNRGITGEWGLRNPLDPPPAPPQAARTGAPSAGRSVSGGSGRSNVYGGGMPRGGSADNNDLAAAMLRPRNRI